MIHKIDTLRFHLERSGLFKEMASYVDRNIPNIFPLAKRHGLSALELMKYLEDEPGQWNVIISQKLSYDGVKSFLSFEANEYLKSYSNANLRVLNSEEITEVEELKGKSFDVVFSLNGEPIALEIKINQKSYSKPNDAAYWQGATHATKKVNDYLLISLDFNSRKKVIEDSGYINGYFVILTSLNKDAWVGKASENSSRTTLRLSVDTPDSEVICGSLMRKQMWCQLKYEQLNDEELNNKCQDETITCQENHEKIDYSNAQFKITGFEHSTNQEN